VTPPVDHFERLGLPRRFSLDAVAVERQYLARSREVHPDYHQLASAGEQRASLELSAALNEAYTTLKDPFRRAEYLLKLEGGPPASEHKQMDPQFLMETLELREQIEEIRAAHDAAARSEMERRLSDRADAMLKDVAGLFEQVAAIPAGDGKRPGLLVQVRQRLNALKYVQGLLRDLRAD
jgi:molecular chaperone HscB